MQAVYRPLRDRVLLGALVLYLLNKYVLKEFFGNAFSSGYVNDLLLVPIFVPLQIVSLQLLRLRIPGPPPQALEVIIPLVVWAIGFEVVLPLLDAYRLRSIADPFDVLAYMVGGFVALEIWQASYGGDLGT